MDVQKLGSSLIALGAIGITISVVWWYLFYTRVADGFSSISPFSFDGALKCLIFDSGQCGIIKALASLSGEIPYEPVLLWISIVLQIIGLAVLNSQKD